MIKVKESFFYVLLLLGLVFLFWHAGRGAPDAHYVLRPDWWPRIVISLSILVCLVLLLVSLRSARSVSFSGGGLLWIGAYFVLLVLSSTLQRRFGFMATTALFSTLSLALVSGRFRFLYLALGVAFSLALALFFGRFLSMSLPRGLGIMRDLSFLVY